MHARRRSNTAFFGAEGARVASSELPLSASSSRFFGFTYLTFDLLGPPQGEARRKDALDSQPEAKPSTLNPKHRILTPEHSNLNACSLQKQECLLRSGGRPRARFLFRLTLCAPSRDLVTLHPSPRTLHTAPRTLNPES